MRIFVAVPIYDGYMHVNLARNLFDEQAVARGLGDDIVPCFLSTTTGIIDGRNCLAQAFMDSDCEKMFFLDSDISWSPGIIAKMAHYPVDFVGGCYRHKMEEESYPIGWVPGRELLCSDVLWPTLIEVAALPGGFICLSRNVFQAFRDKWPERNFSHMGKDGFSYFQMPFKDGRPYGEDNYFCLEWRELGGKIYLDPNVDLIHWNFIPTPYVGNIGNWLKNRNTEETK